MKAGFIGLGGIGKPMAIHVAKSGFDLTVTDLREPPLTDLEQHGARIAGNAREVAAASEIVLASLPSNEVSEELAQNLSVPLSLGSSALQPFLAGSGNGWVDKEYWVIMEIFEQLSGVRVRPPDLTNLKEDKQ